VAKNPKDAMDQAGGAAGNAAQGAADRMQAAGERMKAAADTVTDAGSRLGLKMLDQAESNTNEAFKAMRAAAEARDVTEVMRIQADYLREQSSRSVGQAREIGELIAEFGRNAMGQVTGRN
jgi:hypothetical protein